MSRTRRIDPRVALWLLAAVMFAAALALQACAPTEPAAPKPKASGLKDGTFDPAEWGKVWPQEYADWKATADARPTGSTYKKGGEKGAQNGEFDKLSEYPYLAAMASGIGFAVEFNEPRGHALALTDQGKIDPARLKAGGVCLACKSPYYDKLHAEQGDKLLSMPYEDAVALIPQRHRDLGVSCASCHKASDGSIQYSRLMADALKRIGESAAPKGQTNNVVCGQCHSTYTIPKNEQKQSIGLFMPWDGGSYGDVPVEKIIASIESDPKNHEWTQAITGLKLGYIRHPEFELFTRGGLHYKNGVTCVDCHQPFKIDGDVRVSDHNVMSPLDNGMRACLQCHPDQSSGALKDAVIKIQDETVGAMINAGYATVANAKLIELANSSKIDTTSASAKPLYDQAIADYKEAFYRVAYLNGENSVGFHNPPEALRISADALAYANRSTGVLRSMLERDGVKVPAEIKLDLLKYLENRGVSKLNFIPSEEFKDPRGVAEKLWKENLAELRKGAPAQ